MDIYEGADRAIREMNRLNLADFDRLRLIQGEEKRMVKEVHKVYDLSLKRVRNRFYEIATEAYLLGLHLCGIPPKKAAAMVDEAIDGEWLDLFLSEPDPVAMYSFNSEAERKEARLIEALAVTEQPGREIDRALKLWAAQIGQFAVSAVDAAMLDAYEDAGVREVEWVTEKDEKVCEECMAREGKRYPLKDVPKKAHWGCRCWLRNVK